MFLPYPFMPIPPFPLPLPGIRALRPGPRRFLPPFAPAVHLRGGLPVYGAASPFQYGPAAIDPAELFFRGGHAIGGPTEVFRGVRAGSFPSYAAIFSSGAPLSPTIGIAGAPIIGR